MATGSRLVAVRSAVVAGLVALQPAELDGVEIAFQWKKASKKRERIWTRRARYSTGPTALRASRAVRDEVGRFELVVFVEGVGKDAEWTAGRAVELAQVCEDWLADRKSNQLGVDGMQTLTVEGDGELVEAWNDGGSMAEFVLPIKYTARLE